MIACIGEILIDFICKDINKDLIRGMTFEKKAGGAPANVAASIARLGKKSVFVGAVGDDQFGEFLIETLENTGVDTTYTVKDKENTTLAFVSLQSNGERDFIFNRGAEENLNLSNEKIDEITDAKILHFGSATAMLGGSLEDTYKKIYEKAVEKGKFISFDPNFRIDLWKGKEKEFIEKSYEYMKKADFIKLSEEEFYMLGKSKDRAEALNYLHRKGAQLIAVTLGKDGTFLSNGMEKQIVESVKIKSIDSTGAGDAFVGAFLSKVYENEDPKRVIEDMESLSEIVRFANKVGAFVCTKLGAISSLPYLHELETM